MSTHIDKINPLRQRENEDFNPRAPRGARQQGFATRPCESYFNPRAPRGARLQAEGVVQTVCSISIHALREERDRLLPLPPQPHCIFNPRAPRGARRAVLRDPITRSITTPAPREERDQCDRSTLYGCAHISIHALREERDSLRSIIQKDSTDFNPRAPRGARQAPIGLMWKVKIFQSTRSARSATSSSWIRAVLHTYFNPRAPRGARRLTSLSLDGIRSFQSTRSARSATRLEIDAYTTFIFQSTRSARSATCLVFDPHPGSKISIHALREERDRGG